MKKSISNALTLALACFGCLLALLLTVEHYRPTTLPCSVHSNGCAGTLSSAYAHIGPLPTALLGAGMYALLAALCWKRKEQLAADRRQEEERARAYATSETNDPSAEPVTPATANSPLKSAIKTLDLTVWALALLAFGSSWWLQYIAIWQLHSFCPYCFTSALTVTTIFVLASRDYLFDGREVTGEQKLLLGVVGFVMILMSPIVVSEGISEINKGRESTAPVVITQSLREVVVRPNMMMKGDPKAKYTLVEFADYFCPHCAQAAEKLPAILKQHPEIKLAYRSYVLGLPHPKFTHSDTASVAAEAAARQGKFWEMHDYLFAHQKQMGELTFTDSTFVEYARTLGLDTAKFQKDLADTKLLAQVIQDHDDGDAAGLEMTPTFFLVTPDKVTRFVGDARLGDIMNDPTNDAWK